MRLLALAILAMMALLVSFTTQSANKNLLAPHVHLVDITLEFVNFSSTGLAVHLLVSNPNASAIVIEEVEYQLLLKQIVVKRGLIRQREPFPAGSSRQVRVPVSLGYDEHFGAIIAALNSRLPAIYEISGEIRIMGYDEAFDFYQQGQWSLSQK